MSEEYTNRIGFTGILQLIFITLKLTGHINWSWWWVFSPILFHVVVIIILCIAWGLAVIWENEEKKRCNK